MAMSVIFVRLFFFSERVRRSKRSVYSSEAKVFLVCLKKWGALKLSGSAVSALNFFHCLFHLQVLCTILKDLKGQKTSTERNKFV